MWHDLFPSNFTDVELAELKHLEGKILERVYYTVWKNLSSAGDQYQALDWIELVFSDGQEIAFTAGEHSDGLQIREFFFALEQTKIQQQFRGQVRLERMEVSGGEVWKEAIGQRLLALGMVERPDGLIQNNQLQLNFSGIVLALGLHEEGMTVSRI